VVASRVAGVMCSYVTANLILEILHGLWSWDCQSHFRINITWLSVLVIKVRSGYRASLVCENIVRFLRDFYQTILVGKFPSREISEKCTTRRSRVTDIQSFLPFHHTQRNVRILAVVSFSAAETRRRLRWSGRGSGDAGHRLWHHLCNSELCCNNWLAAAVALNWNTRRSSDAVKYLNASW